MKYTVIAFAVLLAACGDEPISRSIIDDNQVISKNNATANARSYASEVHPGEDANVRMMSDSTIGKGGTCRYGDGWASGSITVQNTKIPLKCSTVGSGVGVNGCLTEAEFDTKEYAKQDGRCDNTITELPKFGG